MGYNNEIGAVDTADRLRAAKGYNTNFVGAIGVYWRGTSSSMLLL